MSKIIDEKDFPNCCRCCLEIGAGKMYRLFDACLVQMLNNISPIQISKDDGYPQQICYRCLMKVSMAYGFIQTVISSQQVLSVSKDLHDSNVNKVTIQANNIATEDEEVNKIAHIPEKYLTNEDIFSSKDFQTDIGEDMMMVTDDIIALNEEENGVHHQGIDLSGDNILNFKDIPSDSKVVEKVEIADVPAFHCSSCDRIFKNEVDRKIHSLKDHNNCLVCNRSIETTNDSPNPKLRRVCDACYACSKKTRDKEKTNVKQINCRYLCSSCGKTFKVRTSLLKHLRYHKTENLLQCNYCAKSFLYTKTLDAHMVTHLGIKAFKCKICNARFTQRGSLNKHQILHTNVKPYLCTVCSKSFAHKSIYKAHLRIHTGEKPYKCNVCYKTFAWPNSLRAHQRCHDKPSHQTGQISCSNENLLKCMKCFVTLPTYALYQAHVKRHQDEVKCRECDLLFPNRKQMLRHYKVKHEGPIGIQASTPDVTCTLNIQNLITNTVDNSI